VYAQLVNITGIVTAVDTKGDGSVMIGMTLHWIHVDAALGASLSMVVGDQITLYRLGVVSDMATVSFKYLACTLATTSPPIRTYMLPSTPHLPSTSLHDLWTTDPTEALFRTTCWISQIKECTVALVCTSCVQDDCLHDRSLTLHLTTTVSDGTMESDLTIPTRLATLVVHLTPAKQTQLVQAMKQARLHSFLYNVYHNPDDLGDDEQHLYTTLEWIFGDSKVYGCLLVDSMKVSKCDTYWRTFQMDNPLVSLTHPRLNLVALHITPLPATTYNLHHAPST
jgi:hypothetical protein